MYNDIAYSSWRTYVEEQCTNVTFVWENNRNSTQNLIYQAKHGDMADLVSIRRYESDSAAQLAPYLMDLSDNPLTNTFKTNALKSFTFNNKLCWYPAPGMMETLMANTTLFAKYGIAIPKTIKELETVCKKFYALGIDPLASDAGTGFRATYLMEGYNYARYFESGKGKKIIDQLLEGKDATLDNDGGTLIASLLRGFKDNHVIDVKDVANSEISNANAAFDAGNAAIFTTGSDLKYYGKDGNVYQAIPCLGDNESEQRLYTYPIFNMAVSKEAGNDTKKVAAINRILKVMYSSKAQQILAEDADALISYNKQVSLPLGSNYQSLEKLIKNNQYFIRFLNRNTFNAALSGLKAVINDGVDNKNFIKLFNENIQADLDKHVIGSSDINAGNQMGEDYPLVRNAASTIAQCVEKVSKADAVLIDAKAAAAPIYQGDYTQSDLDAIVADNPIYEANINGNQLQQLFDDAILATTTYKYHTLEPLIDYPAIAGITAYLYTDGNKNALVSNKNKKLNPQKNYHVVICDTVKKALEYLHNRDVNNFKLMNITLSSCVKTQLSKNVLPQPVKYFVVKEAK